MSKIDKILIACYAGDYWQTKICVASIRKWYPEMPIELIKDKLKGDFSSAGLEDKFGVTICQMPIDRFGWGVSKIEPYFFDAKERVLIIDSDIIFVGTVLDQLGKSDEDFIVSPEYPEDPHAEWFKGTYYDIGKIRKSVDPDYVYPGYVFNTGQMVCTTGLFDRVDFEEFVDYGGIPKLKHDGVLSCADQGILNYLLPKLEQSGRISVGRVVYQVWSKHEITQTFKISEISDGAGYPYLIHWAGDNSRCIRFLHRADLLFYFQKEYYSRFCLGELRRFAYNFERLVTHYRIRLFSHYLKRLFKPSVKISGT
jgi:hypothetical protein